VVVSSENSYALVESPGKKRYIVRRGDFIGAVGGKITRINTRSITVREHDRDSTGKIISTSDEELRLPTNRKTKR
jgi:Tfp pilus assembly protein PilP